MGDFYETQRFPDTFRVGSSIGLQFDVDVTVTGRNSPTIHRVKRSPYPIKTLNMSRITPSAELLEELQNWLYGMSGPYTGFRIRDFSDYQSTTIGLNPSFTDQVLGLGEAGKTEFQLVKEYGLPGRTVKKPILKPVLNTVPVGVGGVQQIIGVDYDVDYTTGIVTFTNEPGINSQVTAGFEYDTPVMFQDIDVEGLTIIAKTVMEIRSLRFLELLNP